jgi:hypothetical protein
MADRTQRIAFVAGGALASLAAWLVTRPDLVEPGATDRTPVVVWLGLEAVAAVLIGWVAPDRAAAVRAVLVGWGLQMAHFAFLGEHHDDGSGLWAVGLFLHAFLAVVAVGAALVADRLTSRG